MKRRKHRRTGSRAEFGHDENRAAGRQGTIWLYGLHAVQAALDNPRRKHVRILAIEQTATRLRLPENSPPPTFVARGDLDRVLPNGAAHQGVALEVYPLADRSLAEVVAGASDGQRRVLALDHVSDPRNIGAILRSAAAFDVSAVVLTRRHAPAESGTLAKAASGALETVPIVRVANLAQALGELAKMGFWRVGLDADAKASLPDIDLSGDLALVLGGEGSGMRRLTTTRCDVTARLPTANRMTSLNVSNAAAIALFLAFRGH